LKLYSVSGGGIVIVFFLCGTFLIFPAHIRLNPQSLSYTHVLSRLQHVISLYHISSHHILASQPHTRLTTLNTNLTSSTAYPHSSIPLVYMSLLGGNPAHAYHHACTSSFSFSYSTGSRVHSKQVPVLNMSGPWCGLFGPTGRSARKE
jgi:hypothetical protein